MFLMIVMVLFNLLFGLALTVVGIRDDSTKALLWGIILLVIGVLLTAKVIFTHKAEGKSLFKTLLRFILRT